MNSQDTSVKSCIPRVNLVGTNAPASDAAGTQTTPVNQKAFGLWQKLCEKNSGILPENMKSAASAEGGEQSTRQSNGIAKELYALNDAYRASIGNAGGSTTPGSSLADASIQWSGGGAA